MQEPDLGHPQSSDRRSPRADVTVRVPDTSCLHCMYIQAYLQAWVWTVRLRSRQGLTPVDHAKNNIAAVRAMSKATKDRRLRGGNAQPMQSSVSPSASSRYASNVTTSICNCADVASSFRKKILCRLVDLSCRDYVRENTKGLVMKRPTVAQESSTLLKEDYGLVPKYLLRFKLDRATSAATKQVRIIGVHIAALHPWLPATSRLACSPPSLCCTGSS